MATLPSRLDLPRSRLLFSEGSSQNINSCSGNYVTFQSHLVENRSYFAGMIVSNNLRGGELGDIMLETTFRLAEALGKPISSTSVIRKPIIALKLLRLGFTPCNEDLIVELLPKNLVDDKKNSLNPKC